MEWRGKQGRIPTCGEPQLLETLQAADVVREQHPPRRKAEPQGLLPHRFRHQPPLLDVGFQVNLGQAYRTGFGPLELPGDRGFPQLLCLFLHVGTMSVPRKSNSLQSACVSFCFQVNSIPENLC